MSKRIIEFHNTRGACLPMVNSKKKEKRFHAGDTVPATGVYYIHHKGHRLPNDATLLKGDLFPTCGGCGNNVWFTVARLADDWVAGGLEHIVGPEKPKGDKSDS